MLCAAPPLQVHRPRGAPAAACLQRLALMAPCQVPSQSLQPTLTHLTPLSLSLLLLLLALPSLPLREQQRLQMAAVARLMASIRVMLRRVRGSSSRQRHPGVAAGRPSPLL